MSFHIGPLFAFLIGCTCNQPAVAGNILDPSIVVARAAGERQLSSDGGNKVMLNSDLECIECDNQLRRLDEHQLSGSPSMTNAFFNAGGNLPAKFEGYDTFDIMELLAEERNEDMCIFSMQQLPPPNADFSTASADFQKFHDYGMAAGQRFQDMIGANKNGGSVLFGSCIIGAEGAKSLCTAGINTTHSCVDKRKNALSKWAQAATIFRITSSNKAAAKENLGNWRSLELQHLPMITWVYRGGDAASGGSHVAGWGQDGGLRAKIVPCSQIATKYHFPTERYDCDHIDAQGNLQTDEVWQHWHSLCSIWPQGNECTTTTTTTTTTTSDVSTVASGSMSQILASPLVLFIVSLAVAAHRT